ncbi:hypothetical protein PMNALOAF_2157 [Methylobacterium adhaesivum]|nr:hypothetical protein PMNALOAF_2157 [Methylobacterium adhaesivum]
MPAGSPCRGAPAGTGSDDEVVDEGAAVRERDGGGTGQREAIAAARGGEAGEFDPGPIRRHEAGGAVEVEAPRLGGEGDVAGARRAHGDEPHGVEGFPRHREAVGVDAPIDHRAREEVAPGEIGVEAGKADGTRAQGCALGTDRRILTPAGPREGDGGFEAAAQGPQHQGREVVEIGGRYRQASLCEEGLGAGPRVAGDRHGAEGEGEAVQRPIPGRAGEVGVGAQGLAGDVAREAHGAVEGAGEIAQGGLQAESPDGAPLRAQIVARHRRRQVGFLEAPGQASIEEGAAGQRLIDGGQILQVDDELGIGEACGGAPVEAGGHLGTFKPGAIEGVTVVDLGEASGEARRTAEQPVEGRHGEGEPVGAGVDVGGDGLAGGITPELGCRGQAAGQGTAGEIGERGEIRERRLDGSRERVLAEGPRIGRAGGRPLDLEPGDLHEARGLKGAAQGEGGPRSDGAAQGRIGEGEALDLRIGGEGEAARLRIGTGGEHGEIRVDPVEAIAVGAQAGGPEYAVHGRTGDGASQAAVEHEAIEFGVGRLGDPTFRRHGAGRDGEIRHPIGREGAARLQPGRARGEIEAVDAEGAAV